MAARVKSARLRRAPILIAALSLACTTTPDAPPASEELMVEDAPSAPVLEAPAESAVLDRREDGALLVGALVPAPPGSDPERVLILRTERAGRSLDPALEGARVLDARFVGEDTIVTLGEDHVLRVHDASGESRELDAQVEPPIAVAGTTLAYARGDMPLFELARADLETGAVDAWTQGMAPVWSPALSPDGREAIFVSGASGAPRLHRIAVGGAQGTLPEIDAFPSSLRAPEWRDGTLSFEDESGASHLVDLASGSLVR